MRFSSHKSNKHILEIPSHEMNDYYVHYQAKSEAGKDLFSCVEAYEHPCEADKCSVE